MHILIDVSRSVSTEALTCTRCVWIYVRHTATFVTGEVIDTQNTILLEDVPVITPNGDVVVKSLSFKVSFHLTTVIPGQIVLPHGKFCFKFVCTL